MEIAERIEKEHDFNNDIRIKKEKEKMKMIKEIQEKLENLKAYSTDLLT